MTFDDPQAAEAEAEQARARAQQASARAAELRRRVEEESAAAGANPENPPTTGPRRALWPAVGVGLAAAAIAGLLTVTGVMVWSHQRQAGERQRSAEFAAAARQGVINLMSIDYTKAKDSVQRVLEGSTGTFHDNFAETSDEFVKALQDEKITTRAEVNDAAVERMSGDGAVVLVSATSVREGPKAPKEQKQPRVWRVVVTLVRDGGQVKLSGVEFV